MLSCWALYKREETNHPLSLFAFSCVYHLSCLLSCLLGVCFVFPVRSSRSSLCHSWSLRSTERRSSPLFPLAHFCPTFPPSKSAFPQCSSMKSTSGRLVLRCPRPRARSGKQRPTDTHHDMNANTAQKCPHNCKSNSPSLTVGENYLQAVSCKQILGSLLLLLSQSEACMSFNIYFDWSLSFEFK